MVVGLSIKESVVHAPDQVFRPECQEPLPVLLGLRNAGVYPRQVRALPELPGIVAQSLLIGFPL